MVKNLNMRTECEDIVSPGFIKLKANYIALNGVTFLSIIIIDEYWSATWCSTRSFARLHSAIHYRARVFVCFLIARAKLKVRENAWKISWMLDIDIRNKLLKCVYFMGGNELNQYNRNVDKNHENTHTHIHNTIKAFSSVGKKAARRARQKHNIYNI